MAKHALEDHQDLDVSVGDITDNDFVNKLQEVAADRLREQSWWGKWKNALATVATIVLQIANLGVLALTDVPVWVTVVVAAVIAVAEVIVQATCEAPITDRNTKRLQLLAERKTLTGSAMADHYR